MKTVVSVTPVGVRRDSRTLKEAASLGRLGYRSIVVEGEASGLSDAGLPFELVTVEGALPVADALPGAGAAPEAVPPPVPAPDPATAPPADSPDPVRRAWRVVRNSFLWIRYRLPPLLRERSFPVRWFVGWNLRARRAIPAADLYVVHHYFLWPAVMSRSVLRRTPYIYDAHDAYFEVHPAQERPGIGERTWQLIERLCVRGARAFVTVSEGVAGILEERQGRRPIVIRNSHDPRLDGPGERDLRAELGLGPDHFLLVFAGNDKNGIAAEEAMQAMKMVRDDVHLAFVGRGHERRRGRVTELGLEKRVHLLPAAGPTEVAGFISSADAAAVLYHPVTRNYSFALPNGFFQALAAGLPVLYPSALTEVAAICEQRGNGVPIDTADPGSIAAAIERLASDGAELDRLRERANLARGEETWEREEEVLARLVAGILEGRPSAPAPQPDRVGEPT